MPEFSTKFLKFVARICQEFLNSFLSPLKLDSRAGQKLTPQRHFGSKGRYTPILSAIEAYFTKSLTA